MTTRSLICRQTVGGLDVRYVHSDGYPEGVGEVLFRCYNSGADVERDELFALGDLSQLGDSPAESVAYHRNYGEALRLRRVFSVDALPSLEQEYVYLFKTDESGHGEWWMAKVGYQSPGMWGREMVSAFHPLTEVLRQIAA